MDSDRSALIGKCLQLLGPDCLKVTVGCLVGEGLGDGVLE